MVCFAIVLQMLYLFSTDKTISIYNYKNWGDFYLCESNLVLFNHTLYTGFSASIFVASGFLLLISMIGSIFLTVQDYTTNKSQVIYDQLTRVAAIFNGHLFQKTITF